MNFTEIITEFSKSPITAIAVLLMLACAYQYKEARQREKDMLELALKIAPLADSLARAVDSTTRIAEKMLDKGGPNA